MIGHAWDWIATHEPLCEPVRHSLSGLFFPRIIVVPACASSLLANDRSALYPHGRSCSCDTDHACSLIDPASTPTRVACTPPTPTPTPISNTYVPIPTPNPNTITVARSHSIAHTVDEGTSRGTARSGDLEPQHPPAIDDLAVSPESVRGRRGGLVRHDPPVGAFWSGAVGHEGADGGEVGPEVREEVERGAEDVEGGGGRCWEEGRGWGESEREGQRGTYERCEKGESAGGRRNDATVLQCGGEWRR